MPSRYRSQNSFLVADIILRGIYFCDLRKPGLARRIAEDSTAKQCNIVKASFRKPSITVQAVKEEFASADRSFVSVPVYLLSLVASFAHLE